MRYIKPIETRRGITMSYTIATMRTSTKEQRKSRKQVIMNRIERNAMRHMTPEQAKNFMRAIKSDLIELMDIGSAAGYQSGRNDERNNTNC